MSENLPNLSYGGMLVWFPPYRKAEELGLSSTVEFLERNSMKTPRLFPGSLVVMTTLFCVSLAPDYVFAEELNSALSTVLDTPTPTNPPCTPDSHEPADNNPPGGYVPTPGVVYTQNFCPDGDVDWYSFFVFANEHYTMRTIIQSKISRTTYFDVDTQITLYQSDSVTVVADSWREYDYQPGSFLEIGRASCRERV